MTTTAETTAAPQSATTATDMGAWTVLKGRIKTHYDLLSDYYYSLWGEHIHHGYFTHPTDTKEFAQRRLIELLLEKSQLPAFSRVLDVGCGVGGTSRHLAREHACEVTGITISDKQVEIAKRLTIENAASLSVSSGKEKEKEREKALSDNDDAFITLNDGKVRFIELDAEKMGDYFDGSLGKVGGFDAVWISEAMSHLPHKQLFFDNAAKLLKTGGGGGGKLVVADWFKNEGLTEQQFKDDIAPIEDGMLLPPLCTISDYVKHAETAGLKVYAEPFDISENVKKTWDISLALVSNPALWALAFTQGRDIIAFLRAFQAMRTGYKNGTFRYAVMVFEKA